jgi:hypothetical protein
LQVGVDGGNGSRDDDAGSLGESPDPNRRVPADDVEFGGWMPRANSRKDLFRGPTGGVFVRGVVHGSDEDHDRTWIADAFGRKIDAVRNRGDGDRSDLSAKQRRFAVRWSR